jgi:hypothetical protein
VSLSAYSHATAPWTEAQWRGAACRAAADLGGAPEPLVDMLAPWVDWHLLASALSSFGHEVALQLRDEERVGIEDRRVDDARAAIYWMCRQIRDAFPTRLARSASVDCVDGPGRSCRRSASRLPPGGESGGPPPMRVL